jgi:hypothetical protein
MQSNYDPERFSDLSETELGKRLWAFLNEPATVLRMITATDLGRPAVAGLPSKRDLVKLFTEQVTRDRWKQFIGHMVRQVMERGPFELDAQGLKVGDESMFTKGSRYRRRLPHWGHLHVEGHRRSGGLLYGGLGADSLDHGVQEIEDFLKECMREEIPRAQIEVRERTAPISSPPAKTIKLSVRKGGGLETVREKLRKDLQSDKFAPNVDLVVTFSYPS